MTGAYAVKAACGISFDATGAVIFDATNAAGDGLQPDSSCVIEVKADDGIEVSGDGVAAKIACGIDFDSTGALIFDATSAAADGLEPDSSCTLAVKADTGIEVSGNGVAIKIGCGIDFDGTGAIIFDATSAAGTGLQPDSSCTLSIDVNAIAGDGLVANGGVLDVDYASVAAAIAGANMTENGGVLDVDDSCCAMAFMSLAHQSQPAIYKVQTTDATTRKKLPEADRELDVVSAVASEPSIIGARVEAGELVLITNPVPRWVVVQLPQALALDQVQPDNRVSTS